MRDFTINLRKMFGPCLQPIQLEPAMSDRIYITLTLRTVNGRGGVIHKQCWMLPTETVYALLAAVEMPIIATLQRAVLAEVQPSGGSHR